MLSIIVPAYNEERRIAQCLDALLLSAKGQPVEIIVVCNGCTDQTYAIASDYAGIKVINTEIGNKTHALNLGEAEARFAHRLYVDGDLVVSANCVAGVIRELEENGSELVAPPMKLKDENASWWVRAHNKIWTQTPYYHRRVGGVIALSATARARFDQFPNVIADDAFLESQVAPSAVSIPQDIYFEAESPTRLSSLIATKTRSRVGYLTNPEKRPAGVASNSSKSLIMRFAAKPADWLALVVYAAIKLVVRLNADRRINNNRLDVWDRDETAR